MKKNYLVAHFIRRCHKRSGLVFILLLAVLLCSSGSRSAADAGEVIRIGGTGGALGGMKEVATAFRKKHPEITITFVPSLGSSGGIKAVLANALDLALSSRSLSEDERKKGAVDAEYATTPFIFVSSRKGGGADLTLENLAAIYRGDMKTWPDGTPIRLILRPVNDTDNIYLRNMSPAMDPAVTAALSRAGMVTAITDQENADMIGGVRGGFGASTLAQVIAEHRPLKVLRLNGVTPSLAALRDGSYPYSKCFSVISSGQAGQGVRTFLDFLKSPEGRAVLVRTGHVAGSFRTCRAPDCDKK
jgi:phosphate transport system substrate-binding protein